MNSLLDQLNFDSSEAFSSINYLINIALCSLLLLLLSMFYSKYGRSLSNRQQLSRVLILVGVTTFIIISIVKSSLALSLGLVGALSIIRFRTAIKEPEELGYFFMAIAFGLGFGANQLLPTIIGAIVLFAIIYLSSISKIKKANSQNLLISVPLTNSPDLDSFQEKITQIVSKSSSRTELIRFNLGQKSLDYNFLLMINDYDSINKITSELQFLDNNMSITFIDSQNMTI